MGLDNVYKKGTQSETLIFLKQIQNLTNLSLTAHLFIYDFELAFDEQFSPHLKSELELNPAKVHLERFLLLRIEVSCERRYKFFHGYEKCFPTFSNKRNMT